jgi:HSP20 family protein
MELDKYESGHDLQQLLVLRDQVDRLSELGTGALEPKVDLLECGDAYRLIMEVPGVPQDNLEVALQGREVIVAGLREPLEGSKRVISERPSGHFQRTITLPAEVNREASSAHLQEGLLILNLPKSR